ncbi:MAG: hypothetical protein K9I29_00025 [Bacteroidales bacterium]|nr:hypothetical protein [Bacteroidales bacterium]MCF8326652.1 hypothetical protein [Bacteroidales bacterium]
MERNITLRNVQKENWRIEQFVENIADEYNIFNSYYSNILVSLVETLSQSKHEDSASVSFKSSHKGLVFKIEGCFEHIDDNSDLIYLISLLGDDYFVEKDYIELIFSINSINSELSAIRKKAFQNYLQGEQIRSNK